MSQGRHIVVGVDGSPGSNTALLWAYDQARSTGAELDVVNVWETPAIGELAAMAAEGAFDDLGALARKLVDSTVERVLGHHPRVKVHKTVLHGYAPAKLAAAAQGATMLVVGSRGRGAFAEFVLGSVAAEVVHRATCPVVVIPAHDDLDRQRLDGRLHSEPALASNGQSSAAVATEGELA